MNKNLLFTIALLLFLKTAAFAQVPNADFETLLSNGTLSNWGNVYLSAVSIDTNGVTVTDSMLYDGGWYYQPSTDAHSGQYALELRNAFNVTQNYAIGGAVGVDEDTLFSAWGISEQIPVYGIPQDFRFYYKYAPVNNDTAYAVITVIDSAGNVLGNAESFIIGNTPVYSFSNNPITYTMSGTPAFMSIQFHTSKPGGQTSFGTRLLVDDVEIISLISVSSVQEINEASILSFYPNPAYDKIYFDNEMENDAEVRIYDLTGKLITTIIPSEKSISVHDLACGQYLIELRSENKVLRNKLIKE